MVGMSSEVKELFTNVKPIAMATCSSENIPNVAYMTSQVAISNTEIVVVDNYMKKTKKNIEETGKASLLVYDEKSRKSYQLLCSAVIKESGELFDKHTKIHRERGRPGKAIVLLHIKAVYNQTPGDDAGTKMV